MKKMNKKGFTIVELVIVIAVIAILAAVMIPTFGGIIKKANASAVQQESAAAYKEAYALAIADGQITAGSKTGETVTGDYYEVNGYTFAFSGSIENVGCTVTPPSDVTGYTFTVTNGQLTVVAPN
jgi:prepilin-type N-terminal cleavage/methylation domain-containing protein